MVRDKHFSQLINSGCESGSALALDNPGREDDLSDAIKEVAKTDLTIDEQTVLNGMSLGVALARNLRQQGATT